MYYDKRWDRHVEITPLQPPEKWRLILRRAADVLDDARWIQGMPTDRAGGYCLLGAISLVAYGRMCSFGPKSNARRAVEAVSRYIGEPPDFRIWVWNDEPGRTKQEVIATLRAAAEQEN